MKLFWLTLGNREKFLLSWWRMDTLTEMESSMCSEELCEVDLEGPVWMNYICIFPWRKLRILYTGLMGILPKPPTDEVGLPINQGTADSLRTLCEILSPLPELCRGKLREGFRNKNRQAQQLLHKELNHPYRGGYDYGYVCVEFSLLEEAIGCMEANQVALNFGQCC
ncbi:hypothetical protein Q9233_004112 [Columba guinea]|nr:hypothetical protein Q9233_004112 [Columba guinea]